MKESAASPSAPDALVLVREFHYTKFPLRLRHLRSDPFTKKLNQLQL